MKILFLQDSNLNGSPYGHKIHRAIFDLIAATSKLVAESEIKTCNGLDAFRGALSQIPKSEKILVVAPTSLIAPKRKGLLASIGFPATDDTQPMINKRIDAAIEDEVHNRDVRVLHVEEPKEVTGRDYQLRRLQSNMPFHEIPKLGAESAIAIDPDLASTPTCRAMGEYVDFIKGLMGVQV